MAERDDEAYQVKELLSGQFKFPDSPQNNKLMYLKDVHKWLLKIRHTFRRYSNFYMFLYATAGYIDTNVELQPRNLREDKVKKESIKKERDRVKIELSESEEDEEPPERKDEVGGDALPEGLRQELHDFGGITTYDALGKFMKVSEFSGKLLADPVLLGKIAPFTAAKTAKPSGNDPLAKFNSLSYERRLSAQEKVGARKNFTMVSDVGEYILPAEDRIKFGNGLTFYYTNGDQESRLHSLLRPYVWSYLRQSLEKTPFSHVITECPVLHDVSHVVQYLLKRAEVERLETDQCFDVLNTIVSLCKKDRNVSLQQWYADTIEKVNDLNEVSATFDCQAPTRATPRSYG